MRGRILVDGIDISTVGIHDVRSRLVRVLISHGSTNTDRPLLDVHPASKSARSCNRFNLTTVFRMPLFSPGP